MENITVVPALRFSNNHLVKSPVVIRVYTSGKIAKTLAMGIKVFPHHWNPSSRCVVKGEINYALYNMKIKKEVSRLESEFTSKFLLGIQITKARAKKIAEGKDPGRNFFQFCREWIPQKYTNKETLRTYNSELTKLEQYSKEVSFGDIDLKFLTGYKRYNICSISINLTFHMARQTFASTVALENGVPIDSVSKMLGHQSIKTTQIYARVSETKISVDTQMLLKKFV